MKFDLDRKYVYNMINGRHAILRFQGQYGLLMTYELLDTGLFLKKKKKGKLLGSGESFTLQVNSLMHLYG